MKTGVYAGSFCPVTNGHVDAIAKAAKLVDKLYVAVGVNSAKKYSIPQDVRVSMLEKSLQDIDNVEVVAYDGLMTDFCKGVNADVMIKSIRSAQDTQQAVDIADFNSDCWNGVTVFVVGDKAFRHVSSSLVRELASLKQDYSKYVPACCLDELKRYL